ncbi:GreA/GreB family elongation factor [Pseudorhodobacter turbinis]|uniref:GreA/GreB family elongation factor n=1 Tax=Pseudorhodobacter turbinis TaxID=2500533 RepID=UPI001F0F2A7D|nr:GreA/GreB family elongation factor [Pseudorhodobacter turbinis]
MIRKDEIIHVKTLTEGAMLRNPALADRMLEELGHARTVKSNPAPKNVVSIGNTVTYRDEATGQTNTVTLVYPEHADILRNRISIMTPVGVALFGLSVGAASYCDTRSDQRRLLTVIDVVPPSENESDNPL